MNAKKLIGTALSVVLCASMLAGCGNQKNETETTTEKGKKTLVIGDTTFNSSNEENNVNPHDAYSGWACIRYGIGETLVKYSDTMEIEPWLAKEWENVDELTWKITLQDNVKFSSGRDMDVDAGFDDGIVAGTGPYIAVDCQSDDHLTLVKNEDYWNGTPKIDELTIRTITDGSTLANALQSGEIQAAYGMAYESYPMFENDAYTFSQISTSRCFFGKMNFDESSVCADPAVRKAIAMGIDKENFVATLLEGNGYVANGVFPEGSAFGGDKVTTETYDPEGAKEVLEAAGWKDTDGDGIREKDGKKLTVRWLTYPSRQELPLLAESAQATLKDIGIDLDINCTADNNSVADDPTVWDVYAMANVQAPTGDPEYWFTVFATSDATRNQGKYSSEKLDELEKELSAEFDIEKRAELAVQMQQTVLDDHAFVFCSFLKMSMISKANVTGYESHACDYYQVTADLDIN